MGWGQDVYKNSVLHFGFAMNLKLFLKDFNVSSDACGKRVYSLIGYNIGVYSLLSHSKINPGICKNLCVFNNEE